MDVQKALLTAMRSEIEGREMYKIAAEKADDSKAREVFQFLAEEEETHFQALKDLSVSHSRADGASLPELPEMHKFDDAISPIFSRDFRNRIKGKHFEMSALSVALKLELDSFQFYEKIAAETDSGDLRAFFQHLSRWEKTHYDMLVKEINFLEQDYYAQNDFTPF